MKTIIILADGAADEPCDELNGKTPLQVAHIPHIHRLAQMGRCGLLQTVPEGFPPTSEVANLAILGYHLPEVYEGRAPLEAESIGIPLAERDLVLRCNLVSFRDGMLVHHSADGICTEQASELIQELNNELATEDFSFFVGQDYRHILRMKKGDKRLSLPPPHEAIGLPAEELTIRPEHPQAEATARLLNELTTRASDILSRHPINRKCQAEGKLPANGICLWSAGYRVAMPTLCEMWGISSGTMVAGVNLLKGIGKCAGLSVPCVQGATGTHTTNYEAKLDAALQALRMQDFVFLHIEASDEAAHEGNIYLKIKTLEYLDHRIVRPLLDEVQAWNEPVTIALLPDHPTPCLLQYHTAAPVPFVIYRKGMAPDDVRLFTESDAAFGCLELRRADEFMQLLLR